MVCAPVVSFASLKAECGDISLPAEVKFRVSPSNVSLDLIDIENLKFIYNNPSKLRADVDAKATFKSLRMASLQLGSTLTPVSLKKRVAIKSIRLCLKYLKNEGCFCIF